ncbi:MAG: M6 family metalloprotease domain-containing protein [Prevotella sp.]|nr:M6 family metalloprotease domain-containing protein [Prevotella sp.]
MKRFFFSVIALLLLTITAYGVPAYPYPSKVKQPDGSTVTVRQNGDEYLHFTTTTDGYTVVRDRQGYFVYAQKLGDGTLGPTSVIAHDAEARTERELSFLADVPLRLKPDVEERVQLEMQAEQARRARTVQARRANGYDYSKFHGLIILVEYSDRSFKYSDMKDVMEGMVNQENYKGTSKTNFRNVLYGINAQCYGSLHDYYKQNSNGIFSPKFDIVGPVKVNRTSTYVKQNENINQLLKDVLSLVDADVDFRNYDTDGDGVVDMIYFIFAGGGSHDSTNDQDLLWPHASEIYDSYNWWTVTPLYKDGVQLGRYACGTELLGPINLGLLDGIGTICHEFSHVLGLPDFYDADYEKSGGQAHHPGNWSLMAGGNYGNYCRTPVGYSLYEKAFLGFCPEPEVIDAEGTYTLEDLKTAGAGFRINSPLPNEYFLFENRQQKGWDASLPGHGMLVHRVDRSNLQVWEWNMVNNNPSHLYYEMLFAGGYKGGSDGAAGQTSDPFPGTLRVTELNNSTSPAHLRTWSGQNCHWGLEHIAESGGIITFDVVDVNVLKSIAFTDPAITVWLGTRRQLQPVRNPDYAPYTLSWHTDNPDVAIVGQDGYVTAVAEGTANITVTANDTLTATCTVSVVQAEQAGNISELRQLAVGTERLLKLENAVVNYAYKGTVYVSDASGNITFTNMGSTLAAGDVISGSIFVRYNEDKLMPVAEATERTDYKALTIESGDRPAPADAYLRSLTAADYASYVTLRGVTLTIEPVDGNKNATVARDGDQMALLRNRFGLSTIKMPASTSGKLFDVTGIYGTEQMGTTVYNALYMLSSITESDVSAISSPLLGGQVVGYDGMLRLSGFRASAPVDVFTTDGRRVVTARTAAEGSLTLPMQSWPAGVYLIRIDGETMKMLKK